jgi:hypothetical protein
VGIEEVVGERNGHTATEKTSFRRASVKEPFVRTSRPCGYLAFGCGTVHDATARLPIDPAAREGWSYVGVPRRSVEATTPADAADQEVSSLRHFSLDLGRHGAALASPGHVTARRCDDSVDFGLELGRELDGARSRSPRPPHRR